MMQILYALVAFTPGAGVFIDSGLSEAECLARIASSQLVQAYCIPYDPASWRISAVTPTRVTIEQAGACRGRYHSTCRTRTVERK